MAAASAAVVGEADPALLHLGVERVQLLVLGSASCTAALNSDRFRQPASSPASSRARCSRGSSASVFPSADEPNPCRKWTSGAAARRVDRDEVGTDPSTTCWQRTCVDCVVEQEVAGCVPSGLARDRRYRRRHVGSPGRVGCCRGLGDLRHAGRERRGGSLSPARPRAAGRGGASETERVTDVCVYPVIGLSADPRRSSTAAGARSTGASKRDARLQQLEQPQHQLGGITGAGSGSVAVGPLYASTTFHVRCDKQRRCRGKLHRCPSGPRRLHRLHRLHPRLRLRPVPTPRPTPSARPSFEVTTCVYPAITLTADPSSVSYGGWSTIDWSVANAAYAAPPGAIPRATSVASPARGTGRPPSVRCTGTRRSTSVADNGNGAIGVESYTGVSVGAPPPSPPPETQPTARLSASPSRSTTIGGCHAYMELDERAVVQHVVGRTQAGAVHCSNRLKRRRTRSPAGAEAAATVTVTPRRRNHILRRFRRRRHSPFVVRLSHRLRQRRRRRQANQG